MIPKVVLSGLSAIDLPPRSHLTSNAEMFLVGGGFCSPLGFSCEVNSDCCKETFMYLWCYQGRCVYTP